MDLTGSYRFSMVLHGRFLEVPTGSQWILQVLTGSQWFSTVGSSSRGSRRFLVVPTGS